MDAWKRYGRCDVVMVDIGALIICCGRWRAMDHDWPDERLNHYYCHGNGRSGTDLVGLPMVTCSELLAYSLVIIGIVGLVLAAKRN